MSPVDGTFPQWRRGECSSVADQFKVKSNTTSPMKCRRESQRRDKLCAPRSFSSLFSLREPAAGNFYGNLMSSATLWTHTLYISKKSVIRSRARGNLAELLCSLLCKVPFIIQRDITSNARTLALQLLAIERVRSLSLSFH